MKKRCYLVDICFLLLNFSRVIDAQKENLYYDHVKSNYFFSHQTRSISANTEQSFIQCKMLVDEHYSLNGDLQKYV